MRKVLIDLAWALGALLVQSSFLGLLLPASWQPNLLLLLTLARGLGGGSRDGLRFGVAAGILADVYYGRFFGLTAITLGIFGSLAGVWRRRLYYDPLLTPILFGALGILALNAFEGGLFDLLQSTPVNLDGFWPGTARVVVNALLAPLLFRWLVPEEKTTLGI